MGPSVLTGGTVPEAQRGTSVPESHFQSFYLHQPAQVSVELGIAPHGPGQVWFVVLTMKSIRSGLQFSSVVLSLTFTLHVLSCLGHCE